MSLDCCLCSRLAVTTNNVSRIIILSLLGRFGVFTVSSSSLRSLIGIASHCCRFDIIGWRVLCVGHNASVAVVLARFLSFLLLHTSSLPCTTSCPLKRLLHGFHHALGSIKFRSQNSDSSNGHGVSNRMQGRGHNDGSHRLRRSPDARSISGTDVPPTARDIRW